MAWSAQEQENIRNFYNANQGDPATIARGMAEIGLSADDLAQFTGQSQGQVNQYLNQNATPQPKPQETAAPQITDAIRAQLNATGGYKPELAKVMQQYGLSVDQVAPMFGQNATTFNNELYEAQQQYGANISGVKGVEQRQTVDQAQQQMNAWAAQNGMQAPNLSDPAFSYLAQTADPLGNWIRQNVGARTMNGGSYDLNHISGQTPQQQGGGRAGNIGQQQINDNNYWGNAANSYLAGNADWYNNAPGYDAAQGTKNFGVPQGAANMPMSQVTGAPLPATTNNGYNPRDARYQEYPVPTANGGGTGGGWFGPTGAIAGPSGQRVGINPDTGETVNLGLGGGYQTNPFLGDLSNALIRQGNNNLNDNILPGIRSGALAAGQYGGTRQGVAEGIAAGRTNVGIASGLASLYGNAYNTDLSNATTRLGQAYQYDLGLKGDATSRLGQAYQYDLGLRGDANTRQGLDNQYALGAGQLALGANTANQNFYTSQRGQDLQQLGIGANLFQAGAQGNLGIGQGQYNLGQQYQNAPLTSLQNYSNTISPYSGMNSTQSAAPGGGVNQAVGGAMGAYQLYQNLMNNGSGNNNGNGNLAPRGGAGA